MDDSAGMAVVEPFGDAGEQIDDVVQRRTPLGQQRVERTALHVAHREVLQTAFSPVRVDRYDVRVLDRRHARRPHARTAPRRAGPRRTPDGRTSARPGDSASRSAREEDLPEAARAEALLDHVRRPRLGPARTSPERRCRTHRGSPRTLRREPTVSAIHESKRVPRPPRRGTHAARLVAGGLAAQRLAHDRVEDRRAVGVEAQGRRRRGRIVVGERGRGRAGERRPRPAG